MFWVSVFWSLVVQYFSFASCTAVFHWLRISFACSCSLLLVRFLRWCRSAWCSCCRILFRSGCHHGACLALCFTHGIAVSVALWMISVMLLAVHKASSALPMLLKSSPDTVIVCWKRGQSALCQALLGGAAAGVWLMYRVHMAWSDVEAGLISYARMSLVMLPAEKQRSISDGDVPFRGKCVSVPGLLCRKKLCVSIQSTMQSVSVQWDRIWLSSSMLVLPYHGWCALRSPMIMAGSLGRNWGRRFAMAWGLPGE
jgi:hypothetical protein